MVNKVVYVLTSNKHKVIEIREILKEYNLTVEQARAPKIEIQAEDTEEVVRFSALRAREYVFVRPLLVEDSGLFIDALKGFPGTFSQQVYNNIGLEGVLKLTEGIENRRAYFKCSVACVCPDERIVVRSGIVRGRIAHEIRGTGGFGFDPIFIPEGYDSTFAELPSKVKNQRSHRALAFKRIVQDVMVFGDTE